ncbi:transcription elongation protein SprT [Arcticibacterium luteifluviistationis]|uniref:Transcription elongation protein SprT n=2 Tax=Arcticibacterium luteifluviistationis TaxID=1784714 RepID=A0A2Z4G9I4_9BACT|nr:transcription elongation protein SprT [Arcticibacterium luteifluviistationis]
MFDFIKRKNTRTSKPVKKASKPVLTKAVFSDALSKKVPADALTYCVNLWEENPFSFSISKTRSSCLGNYKYHNGHHTITVNHDLNPYNFLITYIHEVAHQRVFIKYQKNIKQRPAPHGKEWKLNFQQLMIPLLTESVFPMEILRPLSAHMKNPPASSTRDAKLMKAIKAFNEGDLTEIVYLENIPDGQSFVFKKRKFQRIEKRRTRALCLDLDSKRKYTIPLMAEIKVL